MTTPVETDPRAPGTRIGPYVIEGILGRGGMGVVYRAHDTRLSRAVALKVLPEGDPRLTARFEKEARSASALSHPSIVVIYEAGREGGDLFLAMELIEGETLRDALVSGAMEPRRALALAAAVASALAAAHERGIVHRDIKPENLMLDRAGRVKVLDFGLARPLKPPRADTGTLADEEPDAHATRPGTVLGTPGYMAPEQAAGEESGPAADQFALGAVLYEMLSGKRAFWRQTSVETLAAVLRDDPPPLDELPAPIRWVLSRCLAKSAADRYAATRDLAKDLADLERRWDQLAGGAPQVRERRPSRAWMVAAAAAAAAIGAVAARQLGRNPGNALTYRTITHTGRDHSPAMSPDRRVVAFVSERRGKPEIWLKQVPFGAEAALSTGPDTQPRWSADGAHLYFTRVEGNRTSVWRTTLLGGEERRLLEDAQDADPSPDGRSIAFVGTKGSTAGPTLAYLGIAGPDGAEPRSLFFAEGRGLQSPRWSPDSERIAVTQTSNQFAGGDAVLVVEVGRPGKPLRLASEKSGLLSSVLWDGGGALLYLAGERGVTRTRLSASHLIRRELGEAPGRTLAWLPTWGAVFDRAGERKVMIGAFAPRQNLRLAGRWLTRGYNVDRQPCFSPDGARVAFTSDRTGDLELWELTLATGAIRRVTDDPAEDWDPAYAPDGEHLVWSSSRGGHYEIWMARADGSSPRQVTHNGVDAENPSVTADGKWIVYSSFSPEPAKRGLWKIHPDGSGEQRLRDWAGLPQVSPDGRHVLYRSTASPRAVSIDVLSTDDGRDVPFTIALAAPATASTTGVFVGRARWTPDGRAIAFVAEDERGATGVYVQDFAPGTDSTPSRRALGGFDADTESFALSPGGALITSAVDSQSSLILADDLPE